MKAAYFRFTPHVIQPKSFRDNSESVTRLLLFLLAHSDHHFYQYGGILHWES